MNHAPLFSRPQRSHPHPARALLVVPSRSQ
jgi:hypothetical protein